MADVGDATRYRCTNSECVADGRFLAVGEIVTYEAFGDTLYHGLGQQGALLDVVEGRTNVTRLPLGLPREAYPMPCGPVVQLTGPQRIRLRRRKGWRKPPDAVVVARPTKWGNPYTVAGAADAGYEGNDAELRAMCVAHFTVWLAGDEPWYYGAAQRESILASLGELRGRDLACWCPLDQPCHADVLLELANR